MVTEAVVMAVVVMAETTEVEEMVVVGLVELED